MKRSLHMSRHLRPNVSPEEGRDVRARAWAFVFECWHTKKGDHDDLTSDSTKKTTSIDKKGTDHANIHGD